MVSVDYLKFSRAHRWFEQEHDKLTKLPDGEWIALVERDKDFNLLLSKLRQRA